ncbi:MAG: diaminopimelate epimerase [Crocinitomicaceae bacterium]
MKLKFYKYQATGNDFIMINNMDGSYDGFNIERIPQLCDRKFGIGADGLIMLKNDTDSQFYVDYYNADGTQSFCGNGARCSVAFAKQIGLIKDQASFNAIDGLHFAEFLGGDVKLEMTVNEKVQEEGEDFTLNTGSPHYCRFDQNEPDIVELGKSIRYADKYALEGINVNSVRIDSNGLSVQTYERGVEDETLSCGTGVTACALVAMNKKGIKSPVRVETKGGTLYVEAIIEDEGFKDVFLIGPANFVYSGSIDV